MKTNTKTKFLNQFILNLYETNELITTIKPVDGTNDKIFGKDFTGSCISTENPYYSAGIFFIQKLNKYFIKIIYKNSGRTCTEELETLLSKGLKAKMIAVAEDRKCRDFPSDLILKGLKA